MSDLEALLLLASRCPVEVADKSVWLWTFRDGALAFRFWSVPASQAYIEIKIADFDKPLSWPERYHVDRAIAASGGTP